MADRLHVVAVRIVDEGCVVVLVVVRAQARRPVVDAAGGDRRLVEGAHVGPRLGRKGDVQARLQRLAGADPEMRPLIAEAGREGTVGRDYKSALQERLQAEEQPLPEYQLTGTIGPDHRKLFQVSVVVRGERIADGTGASKKEAEQDAARLALEKLSNRA